MTGFLKDLDRSGREGARAFYLESWNGTGSFTYDRISRGTIDIEACCVSILGTIQPGPLSQYIESASKGGAGDDGLIQRFQLLVWPDPPRVWRNVDRWPDTEARRTARAVFDRLNEIDYAALGTEIDEDARYLRFDDQGQNLFDEWRSDLENRLRSDELPPALQSHLAKYRSLIPSLALLIHLADSPTGGPVTENALIRACGWGEYLEGHAQRLYSPALDPAMSAARELDRHMLRGDVPNEFAARDIYRKGWRLLDREGTYKALDIMADYNRVRQVEQLTEGRTAQVWRVHPDLWRAV